MLTVTTEIDNKTVAQLAKWKCHSEPFAPCHSKKAQRPKSLAQCKLREGSQHALELYRRLLELKIEDAYLSTLNSHIEAIANKFSQANFILQFEDLLRDWALLQELFRKASSIIGEYFPSNGSKLEKIPPKLLEKAANAWYQYSPLYPIAAEIGIDWEPLSLCLKAAFHSILIKYSERLPSFKQDSWRQRTCPLCGGKPDLAFLSKETHTRWLVCSRCDTEWLFFRLECPFCGNRDQERLAYLTDEKELYRLYTCEQCHTYIKAIDLRRTEDEVLFPLERVLTLDMDRQAHEAGYKPGWIAQW